MALAIDGVALHPVRMPLSRTVRWASSSEAHADYMILELRAGGLRGVAEGCVKLNFAATTLKVLAAAFEDILDRKSTRLNSSHIPLSRMPSSA